MATTPTLARYGREHNGANVLALGASLVTPDEARAIIETFLSTPMTEPRYISRLAKVKLVEDQGGADAMTSSDLQRLIQLVTEEVLSATGLGRPVGRAAPATRMNAECCPDRLRGVLDAGANRIGVYAGGGAAARRGGVDRPHAAEARGARGRRSSSCAARPSSTASRRSA